MRTITNDYRDARIMNLGSGSERGPYLVTQTGVAPRAERPRTQMFVLRPDGRWVDFNTYACQESWTRLRCKTRNAVVGRKRNNFLELNLATDHDVVHLAEPKYRPL